VDVSLFEAFIPGVIAGSAYNFQIRSLRPRGTFSTWVSVTATISVTLSISATSGVVVAPSGTLTSAVTALTADIVVAPFTATVGSLSVACLTAGAVTLSSLTQSTLYYVYYVDATFAGGAITPVATLNTADFLGKLGYFLIGSITTAPVVPVVPATTLTVVSAAANYTAVSGNLVICTTTAGGFTVTLPPPTVDSTVSIKKVSTDRNNITVAPSTGLIDGDSTLLIGDFGSCADLAADGTNWWIT
jgi:hypothetical protein